MKKFLLAFSVGAACWWLVGRSPRVVLGPGVFAPDPPVQEELENPVSRTVEDFVIADLASFRIRAKVLGKEIYRFDQEAEIAPVDLVLGWGRMSDESVLDEIDISQSFRFYHWKVDAFPIPRREIESHSANMHLIPATDAIRKALREVMVGDIIEIDGTLVGVTRTEDGWRWESSLKRTDTGGGACELVWVESLRTGLR